MSLINQLNATTEYFWLQTEPQDIVNKASALLWKLMQKAIKLGNWEVRPSEIVDGGLMVKVPLKYGSSHHGSYGKDTVIPQSKKDLIEAARFRWAGAYGANSLNLDDLTQNTGDEAIIHLTEQYIEDIKINIRVDMANQVIEAAADSDSINGLGDLFNTTTSTEYGSIDEDEMATWKANVITTALEISFETMQQIFRTPGFGDHEEVLPNFCVTTQELVDGYERSLHPQQRYQHEDLLEAGWRGHCSHRGAPIVGDPYYTSNSLTTYMDALNLRFLSLRSHKDYNFTTPEWVAKKEGGQPDMIAANTRWRGNLFCNNRQMHVRCTNLSTPS
jgi:hypothetical protein